MSAEVVNLSRNIVITGDDFEHVPCDPLLTTDTQGCIMTALVSEGRQSGDPLVSELIVTDGHWHRIGLVWDGSYRSLYVDDELVATDVGLQNNLSSHQGGLYLGAANDRQSGLFWSGLIDGVRIYDRVVAP